MDHGENRPQENAGNPMLQPGPGPGKRATEPDRGLAGPAFARPTAPFAGSASDPN